MKVTTRGPLTTCPRCGAVLSPDQARRLPGPPGYHPALTWPHRRPDTGAACSISSGLPLAPCAATSPADAAPAPEPQTEREA